MIAEPGTRITFVAIEGQVSVDITIRRMDGLVIAEADVHQVIFHDGATISRITIPAGWTCADCHGATDAVCRCEEWS